MGNFHLQMDLESLFQIESPWSRRALSLFSSWSWTDHLSTLRTMALPIKFQTVTASHNDSNPFAVCCLETEIPYLIHKNERIVHGLIFHLDCPHGYMYRLPNNMQMLQKTISLQ